MIKIGMIYVKGAVPGFENFGNLPTTLVKSNGLVNGIKASEVLDGLIIPGGTILESQDVSDDLKKEIKIMGKEGKPIIGICAGFQILGNKIDIGRNSPCPIEKEGLGLIDVNFSPLISNDRVKAKVYNNSYITDGIKEDIDGFHCHTYGKVEGDGKPLFYSKIQRMNYGDVNEEGDYNIFSGVVNDDGNVIGTMIHNCLDENPALVNNVFKYIDASEDEIAKIYEENKNYKKLLNKEIGIESEFKISKLKTPFLKFKKKAGEIPRVLMIGSNGSDSGKTFIITGLAGALRKRGLKVALIKIGPDVRDLVPGLYLTKGIMEEYASIKIGHLGWMEIEKTLEKLKNSNYDIVLIEGVMSVFTGLLNEKIPYSGSEIASSSKIPILLVGGVNKGGIESSAIDLVAHANILKSMNVDVSGIILNKVYSNDIFNNVLPFIKNQTGVKNILSIPKLKLEKRGNTPEVEIRYDLFSETALKTIEENINIEQIINMSKKIEFSRYLTFDEIKKIFK